MCHNALRLFLVGCLASGCTSWSIETKQPCHEGDSEIGESNMVMSLEHFKERIQFRDEDKFQVKGGRVFNEKGLIEYLNALSCESVCFEIGIDVRYKDEIGEINMVAICKSIESKLKNQGKSAHFFLLSSYGYFKLQTH